jgi:hypothetical protein
MADATVADSIQIDKPERGSKDGYLQTFFNTSLQMNRLIAEGNGISDPRIRLFTLKMISSITDDVIRKTAFDYFFQQIDTIMVMKDPISGKLLSMDERNQKIADFCCGEMQGHITAWYDEYMGITHRLKLGRV